VLRIENPKDNGHQVLKNMKRKFDLGETEKCADENADCECEIGGYVWYGEGSHWHFIQIETSSIQCSNDVFGDPKAGTYKHCYCVPLDKME